MDILPSDQLVARLLDDGDLLDQTMDSVEVEGDIPEVAPSPARQNSRENRPRFLLKCLSFQNAIYITGAVICLSLLGVIPWLAVRSARHGSVGWTAFFIAGFFVVLTVPLSVYEIILHLTNWFMPDVQKYVVRILWMVPIYSLQSWASLRFSSDVTGYLNPFRDLYEAFVIEGFVYYLIELLGGEQSLADTLRRKEDHYGDHPWPLNQFVHCWAMGEEFMLQCKFGALQFVVVKAATTIVYVMLRPLGLYSEGVFDLKSGFTYVSMLLNASMAWAMYCLVKLFFATKEELRSPKDWRPVGKFLCIKGVVFFTFWQGFVLFILRNSGVIGGIGEWDAHNVANGLQDMLVCIEMLVFAIAHKFTFTHKDYLPAELSQEESICSDQMTNGVGDADQLDDDADYRPPNSPQRLARPLSVSRALWSSTVPGETFSDIKRFKYGAQYAAKMSSGDETECDLAIAESI
uniref:Transmembrane protein 184C n=1 Tax=Odontella aurita TaxID=265563 RepID=A0A7S4HS15_9STRA|mmetsp:Transcript_14329/g.42018  ORF Transcript_14329/g.42018 Transcript_14329/m.42018 type:complete len:461 (+) Transcript_14329:357-1739(+)|eukprot:CAMPEP_0113525778 /NCGR_PEP_ID=MMETSP0015_2-20120614/361_1 /TAXON_ID=2838 /ORGANISM="Odontella" /LENGTH=460 /DNA_ID=CAMNT_0000424003 /DNA_START=271 /DNA_END=1653 /DNA_ORIENTATION=+ /assembly_acc=CAM_ASM_000160